LAFGEAGDVIPDKENALWQIAASGGFSTITTTMNGMPTGFHASSSKNIFVNWMQITFAQSGSLAKSFPDEVYYLVLDKIVGYNYDNARVPDWAAPPGNTSVVSDTITCDEDPTGEARTVKLYAWNFVDFTESAITGSLAGGTWTFSSVPAGNYVLAYDDGLVSVPTAYLTVS
jgi:hypothetical protein